MTETPGGRAVAGFTRAFGTDGEILVRAPGRVNLIGEHTDYNDGFVLPVSLSVHTAVVGRSRADRTVNVVALDFDAERDSFGLDAPLAKMPGPSWKNHIRGVFAERMRAHRDARGCDLAIAGNIPKGSGLSSSASLAVAVGTIADALDGVAINRVAIARQAQASEISFVGTQCGIMDQLASACGQQGHALMIDCRSLAISPVRLPDETAIVIVQSGVVRNLSEGRYNDRRRECAEAARALNVSSLRDATPAMLDEARNQIDPTAFARARHVVSENARTQAAAAALLAGDLATLGVQMAASHVSLRDDFCVSHPDVDRLVDIAQDAIGREGGARMTGGGFGGSIVAVLARNRVDAVIDRIVSRYRDPAGCPPTLLVEHARMSELTVEKPSLQSIVVI